MKINVVQGGQGCRREKHFPGFSAGETLKGARRRVLPEFFPAAALPTLYKELFHCQNYRNIEKDKGMY
jgi:hypothetical protein